MGLDPIARRPNGSAAGHPTRHQPSEEAMRGSAWYLVAIVVQVATTMATVIYVNA